MLGLNHTYGLCSFTLCCGLVIFHFTHIIERYIAGIKVTLRLLPCHWINTVNTEYFCRISLLWIIEWPQKSKKEQKNRKNKKQSKTNSCAQNTPCHNRLICYSNECISFGICIGSIWQIPLCIRHVSLKCAHMAISCNKWCIVGYGSGALLDLYKCLLSGQRLSAQLSFNHTTWWYLRRHLERDAWKQEIL